MVLSSVFGGLAALLWIGVVAYVGYTVVQRTRGKSNKISLSLTGILIVAALLLSTLSAGVVVIDAREVGVVFNDISGLRSTTLSPGMHVVTPFLDHVYRYSTAQQSYTMAAGEQEDAVLADDSLWSRTVDGQKVGIDATVFFEVDPAKAAYVHAKWQERYLDDFVRPSVLGVTRSQASKYAVAEVYSLKRDELQTGIEEELRNLFSREGLTLKGFTIRNVNFTDEYAASIEQKQIAEQEAERMRFVVAREELEAERKRVEAKGLKDAEIIRAEGEAEALQLISRALQQNPSLVTYRYVEKIAPNMNVMMIPSGAPVILDPGSLLPQAPAAPEAVPSGTGEAR